MPYSSTRSASAITPTLPHAGGIQRIASLLALTKPRLNAMSVMTALVGHRLVAQDWELPTVLALLAGTTLSGAGALALNQWRERDTDCLMRRTRDRPLPLHQVTPGFALAWSLALALAGIGVLAVRVNLLAAAISAATIVLYACLYTPLKRHSRWATEVGAIPGALPPLIGCAAAGQGITATGWLVFAVLWLWQMPHFFAIGWCCRAEYRAAGFPLLPAVDATGKRTAGWALGYTAALVLVTTLAWTIGLCGAIFGLTAFGLGGGMLRLAWCFRQADDDSRDRSARRLFFASLLFLPVVLASLILDRFL